MVLQLGSVGEKISVMRNEVNLRGTPVVLKDLLTRREKEIQTWIEEFAEEIRKDGGSTQTGYLKIKIKEMWLEWDEEEGDLRPGKERLRRQSREE